MGFTTGFFGGLTLTTSILYLSVVMHQRNRAQQAFLLRQQATILNSVVDPQPPAPPPTARLERDGLMETAKDRWNEEVQSAVRYMQTIDWANVRESLESNAAGLWARVMEQGRQEAAKKN